MTKETITFRTESEKRDALDAVATALGRDRSFVLNQAVDSLLEVYRWQVEHIKEGQRQARNEEFVSDTEWREAFNRDHS